MVGATLVCAPVTAPTEGAMDRLVAPLTVQASVLEPPRVMVAGVAEKALMVGGETGAVTVTVALAVTWPPGPLAVRVYVVLAAGETTALEPLTRPMPLSMAN